MINLLFFASSSQDSSLNSKLVRASAELTGSNCPDVTDITLLHLSDYDLPVFPDTQDGLPELPEKAKELHNYLAGAHGIFIGSDEYTGTYSARFRNVMKWLASAPGDPVFTGKPIALCGAAPGGVGGLRGQPALGQLLRVLGANVISQHIRLGTATSAFGPHGALLPSVEQQLLEGAIKKIVQAANNEGAN